MSKFPVKLYVFFVCGLLSALFGYILSQKNNYTTQQLAETAEIKLHLKEIQASEKLNELSDLLKTQTPDNLFKNGNHLFEMFQDTKGVSFYVYDKDSLCFWTDNQPAVELHAYTNENNVQLIKIRNGWYEYIKHPNSTKYNIVALIAIKAQFDFENRYLNSNFSDWLSLPENTKLVSPVTFLPHTIKSQFGPPLFQISRTDGLYKKQLVNTYVCLLYILSFVFFIWALFVFSTSVSNYKVSFVIVFSFLSVALRTLMIYYKVPKAFYDTSLYDVKIFADASSFYFSYLGDAIINSLLVFMIAVLFYKTDIKLYIKSKLFFLVGGFIGVLLLAAFSFMIQKLVYSLIYNSTISYNINDLFNFSVYSIIGLFIIGVLIFAFYICVEKIMIELTQQVILVKAVVVSLLLLICFAVIICVFYDSNYLDYFWLLPIIAISFILRRYKASYNFINIGLVVLVTTIIVSSLFNKHEQLNKRQNFEAISLNLADRQDVIAENEFNKISLAIKTDMQLKNLLSLLPLSSEQIEQRLRQINFSGYFERYEIVMSLFKNDCTPVFMNLNAVYLNEDYFKQQINNGSSQTICDDLYFINKEKKSVRYIAKIEIEDVNKNKEKNFHLYVQLEPKLAANQGTFPDLLLDKSLENKLETKQLSYAIYESNKLRSSFGEYQYPLFINSKTFKNERDNSFEHFLFNSQNNTVIVISDKEFGIWGRFTSNSYLFIFFSILVLASIWINFIVLKRSKRFNSLNNRIQFILVSVVILSLTGVVIGTIWVVTTQFELKNQKDLIHKSQSVFKELQQTIGQQQTLETSYKDYANYRLKRLSQLFGSDITLFNAKGQMFSSSQPAIYEQGLISKWMNPLAYTSFLQGNETNYTQKENIGTLKYLSAYQPFYNKNDKLLGYINLPYFSRQKDLEKELTAYLTTLINIYTILFAITTLIALLVSNLLTKPLRIIKMQISNIQFGKFNEALKWNSNDEIGDLVSEYNNMLIKLEKSSLLLAQSERESAWREMAKQVAHEIKNPLTPMKLNIQHLQRVVETHPDDINERVEKVSEMLIEQIDTLSHIANEFSNFAKLPKANLEIVNLYSILQNVTHLFQQNTDCEIILNASDALFIMADKEQCLRIFTNLLKNAEQSIPITQKGKIEINAKVTSGEIVVTVKDNGCGIPEELNSKMFVPNFTTKTTGTGLGLAMVKNSVISFNGTISFDSEVNVGTVFTLIFPEALTV